MSSKSNAIYAVALFAMVAGALFAVVDDIDAEESAASATVTYCVGDSVIFIDPVKVDDIYELKSWDALNAEAPEACKFTGWYVYTYTGEGEEQVLNKTAAGKAVVIPKEGLTFYAEFELTTYTITIKDGDETLATAESKPTVSEPDKDGKTTIIYGNLCDAVVKDTPDMTVSKFAPAEKDGSAFAGWNADLNAPVKSDMTISAMWKAIHTIAWVVDGVEITKTSSADMTAPSTPSKPNFDFNGWALDGKIVDLATLEVTSDITLIAVFTPAKVVITFMCDGAVVATGLALYGKTIPASEVPAAPEGFEWDFDFSGAIIGPTTINAVAVEGPSDPADEPTEPVDPVGPGDEPAVPGDDESEGSSNAILYTGIAVALIIIAVLVVIFIHWLKTKDKI